MTALAGASARMSKGMAIKQRTWMPKCANSGSPVEVSISRFCIQAQMAIGSQQIVESVNRIDHLSKEAAGQAQTVSAATEEQSASMEEIASSSQSLAQLALELRDAVGKFRV